MMHDAYHMQHALRLAQRALGRVAPNPAVGCLIVSPGGRIVGRGFTQDGGRPHAEAIALAQAGDAARGATVYVTLEPCAHHGQSAPCAEALIDAGVSRVVIALKDPDGRVNGRGLKMLQDEGIVVCCDVLASEGRRMNAGFLSKVEKGRPLVTLKIAQSLDGRTATSSGESKWITSSEARRFGHLLRAQHDAVLVGIETALADDPELTCRIAGLERRSPVRVVLDTRLRLSEGSKLARSAQDIPTIIYSMGSPSRGLKAAGAEIVMVARDARGRPDVAMVLRNLADRGITRLLVEGGAGVHASFLDRKLADRLEIFTGPLVLGGAGHSAIDALAALALDEVPRFRRVERRSLGPDLLETFEAAA
jgi:diaminohydroxyphosphoribosylaminopyrimidine deaminase / 5-amino-6-(5-phosphoribosylamino)uracil reductase